MAELVRIFGTICAVFARAPHIAYYTTKEALCTVNAFGHSFIRSSNLIKMVIMSIKCQGIRCGKYLQSSIGTIYNILVTDGVSAWWQIIM